MRPGSDPTQQRTVAELLAQHGGVDTAVRRRRRRDDPDDGPDGPVPAEPETVRDLVPPGRGPGATPSRRTPPAGSVPVVPGRPAGSTARPVPPRATPPADGGGPVDTTRLGSVAHGSSRRLPGPSSGPGPVTPGPRRDRPYLSTALRPAPGPLPGPGVRGPVSWTPPAGGGPVRRDVPEPGPATGAWNPFETADDAAQAGLATVPGSPPAAPPEPPAGRPPAWDAVPLPRPRWNGPDEERPGGDDLILDEDDLDPDDLDPDDLDPDALDPDAFYEDDLDDDTGFDALAEHPPGRARSWAGVVAQWLAGAVVGAVLWVLFRYLWRGLPVVAFAAAVLVTAGLVVGVRQLLHDDDRRTTAFAVLVGLLLTASPAVLVLLGR